MANGGRFTVRELRLQLEKQGLELERLTYANTLLFPIAVAWRWLTRWKRGEPQSDVRPLPRLIRWLNPLLVWLLGMEAAWLRHPRRRLPYGLSAVALAHKPEATS
mgnify:CR=1 FL=1